MSYCRLRSTSSDTFFKCHFRCFKTQRREQLLTLLILQSMISASQPSLPCPAHASFLSIYYNSLFSVTGCVKIKTGVCLGSGTSCLIVFLILIYTGQACLNKKVDIDIPRALFVLGLMCSCLALFFYYLCPTLAAYVHSWEDCCLSAHLL